RRAEGRRVPRAPSHAARAPLPEPGDADRHPALDARPPAHARRLERARGRPRARLRREPGVRTATMGGRIPTEAIQHIRERASLTEIVWDVVTLRKRGRTVVGLCPFHTEKTPSFTVSEERGFYHCFGCGEHGDVFGFVMKTQSLAFPEAIRTVAQRFGLPVPEEAAGRGPSSEPLGAGCEAAAAFFRGALRGPQGAPRPRHLPPRGL